MKAFLSVFFATTCLLFCSFFSYHFYVGQISPKTNHSLTLQPQGCCSTKNQVTQSLATYNKNVLAQINDTNAEIISENYKKFKHTVQKLTHQTSNAAAHVYEFLSSTPHQKTT
jgi:hypothetical protein